MVEGEPSSGGDPETFGRCLDCSAIYPVQRTEEGLVRPIGTGGSCKCGGTEFELYRVDGDSRI